MESPFQGLQYYVLGYWWSLYMWSTTALNVGANWSLFAGTSIFQKVLYEALALPSFTVERPSTIGHQPPFLLFYITASDCGILCRPYLSRCVVWCQPVAQIVNNGLVYQRQKGAAIALAQDHQNGCVLTQYDSTMMAHFLHVYNYKIDGAEII